MNKLLTTINEQAEEIDRLVKQLRLRVAKAVEIIHDATEQARATKRPTGGTKTRRKRRPIRPRDLSPNKPRP